ncbi:MAG: diguanylate cyclase [Solirubrobacterales bacterium]
MDMFLELIKENQEFLVKRILTYAKIHGYVKYTSTLEEAWAASISGLSKSMTVAIKTSPAIPEFKVDCDFLSNPICSFGVFEAKKHRGRGISLDMFLGLMKYYRQAYFDLIIEKISNDEMKQHYLIWVNRYFDYNEIAFCTKWSSNTKDKLITELQEANRKITNEKNKYLTIFESMSTPALLLDAEDYCININNAAQKLILEDPQNPGFSYYAESETKLKFGEIFPWLESEFKNYLNGNIFEITIENDFKSKTLGIRNMNIQFHKMLDISGKFSGTVVLFADMTEYKIIEEQLRRLSFHDSLTGLYNRGFMIEEINRLSTGRFNPVGVVSIDVDGLKLVNDNYGHNAGDNLLIRVSEIIKKNFRESDVMVRNGGDEFTILMPFCRSESVKRACDRLRDKINLLNEDESRIPLSISIGWCVGEPGISCSMQEIIKEADKRMYYEKGSNHLKYADIFKEKLEKYGMKLI